MSAVNAASAAIAVIIATAACVNGLDIIVVVADVTNCIAAAAAAVIVEPERIPVNSFMRRVDDELAGNAS